MRKIRFLTVVITGSAMFASTLAFAAPAIPPGTAAGGLRNSGQFPARALESSTGQFPPSAARSDTSGTASGTQGQHGLGELRSMMRALQGDQLKSCEAREDAIKNRSSHLGEMATRMEKVFAAIAGRVEEYYTATAVPSGKTISNYDSLVSDIQMTSSTVQTALAAAQSDYNNFSCTSSDPKGTMMQFNTDMRSVKSALQDYRASIINLITAIRSASGMENSSSSASSSISNNPHPQQDQKPNDQNQ